MPLPIRPLRLCVGVFGLAGASAGGQTIWTNPAGGSANLEANWSAGVPTQGSAARFDLAGPYAVSFAAPVQASAVDINASEVTFDLGRQTFAASTINIGPGNQSPSAAALVVRGGRLSSSGTLSVGRASAPGTLTIRDGGIVEASSLRAESNSVTSVTGPGSLLSFGSLIPAAISPLTSQLTVADGGIAIGGSTGGSGGSPGFGSLTVRGAGSRVRNVFAANVRIESGAAADYATLAIIGGDMIVDRATLSCVDLVVGPASFGNAIPPGRLVLRSSTLSAVGSNAPLRVNAGSTLELDDATLLTSRTLLNEGAVRGSGRSLGHLDNAPSGTVSVGAGQHLSFEDRALANQNRGLVDVTGGEFAVVNPLNNAARIVGRDAALRFAEGGTAFGLNQANGASFMLVGGVNTVYGNVANGSGARLVHTGSSQTIYYGNVSNGGAVQTSAGSTALFLGNVTGPGAFTGTGTTVFEGGLSPAGPAALAFGGDVELAGTSRLHIDLAGTERGADYGAIDVAGGLTLGGAIVVTRSAAFVPLPGQRYEVARFADGNGAVDVVNATGLAGLRVSGVLADRALSLALDATPGDSDLDARVDFVDLVTLAQHYGRPTDQTWLDGDFTLDGGVGFTDLVALAQHYGATADAFASDWALAQALVPEPIGLSAALLPLVATRRRRTV